MSCCLIGSTLVIRNCVYRVFILAWWFMYNKLDAVTMCSRLPFLSRS